jgi:outer membrane lipoprotein SlyB
MIAPKARNRIGRRHALAAGIAAAMLAASPAGAQPCNPLIDGTYCATQMPRGQSTTQQPRVEMRPIQDLGSAITGSNSPATLGGISIRGSGGGTCIGLLRRGACN